MITEEERQFWHNAAAQVATMLTGEMVEAFGGDVSPQLRGALARIARNAGPDDIRLVAAEITRLRENRAGS